MATLLELNDSISAVLSEANTIITPETDDNEDRDSDSSNSASTSSDGGLKIREIMYMLRRMSGNDHHKALSAVSQLIQRLMHCEGDAKIKAVYEMRGAGALETLLTALPRCAEWPDVEIQISKAVSVLVTYEDNWQLLQKSALDILAALHSFHVKSQSRAWSTITSVEQCGIPLPSRHSTEGGQEGSSTKDSTHLLVRDVNESMRDVRGLIAAAIAKLTLVFCAEWGKAEIPLGLTNQGFSGFSGHNFIGISGSGTSGGGNGMGVGSGAGGLGVGGTQGSDSNGNRRRATSGAREVINAFATETNSGATRRRSSSRVNEYELESARTLTGVLDLIHRVCDNGSLSPPQEKSTPGTPRQNMQVSSSFISTTSGSGVSSSSSSSSSSSTGVAGQYFSFQQQQILSGKLRGQEPLFSPADNLADSMGINNAVVLCSIALCNLAEFPQCRPGLATGGALKLLREWLELGSDILLDLKTRFEIDDRGVLHPLNEAMGRRGCGSGSRDAGDHSEREIGVAELRQCREKYTQVCELINNAAAAIMYIVGGQSDCRYLPAADDQNRHSFPSADLIDYMIGYIDAQVVSEGIPAAIVKFIQVAIECNDTDSAAHQPSDSPLAAGSGGFTRLDTGDDMGSTGGRRRTLSMERKVPSFRKAKKALFPRAAGIHLAQALFQLSTRKQNKQHLSSIGAPLGMCALFVSAVSLKQAENISVTTQPADDDSTKAATRIRPSLSVGMDSSVNVRMRLSSWNQISLSEESTALQLQERGVGAGGQYDPLERSGDDDILHPHGKIDKLMYMGSVASACLDALTFYLYDSRGLSGGQPCSYQQSMVSPKPPSMLQGSGLANEYSSSGSVLVDALCGFRMIESLKVQIKLT